MTTQVGDDLRPRRGSRRPAGARSGRPRDAHRARARSVAALARGKRTARDRAPRRDSGQHVPPLTRRNSSSGSARPPFSPSRPTSSCMTLDDILRLDAVEEVKRDSPGARGGSTEIVEYSIEQPEQRDVEPIRHLEARIVRSGSDEVVVIVRDITERKRQEEALESLVDEQAALSRVAVAVATEKQPEILFDIVTEALGRLLGADAANLVRFGPDSTEGQIVSGMSRSRDRRARTHGDHGRRTAHPRPSHGEARPRRDRRSGHRPAPAPTPDRARRDVRGRCLIELYRFLRWPNVVSVTGDKTFPEGAEERIEKFAALVSVALANAETLTALSTLAEEQAALSRVAVAVATEEPDRALRRGHAGGRAQTRRGRRQPDPFRPAQRAGGSRRRHVEQLRGRDRPGRHPCTNDRRPGDPCPWRAAGARAHRRSRHHSLAPGRPPARTGRSFDRRRPDRGRVRSGARRCCRRTTTARSPQMWRRGSRSSRTSSRSRLRTQRRTSSSRRSPRSRRP